MIIEQHYDDEVLIGLLDEAEEDSHVPVCDTCTGTLESYRDLSAALHDDSVWDERELPESASPQTTNFLRTFAERTRAEDIAAGPIVAKLVADPTSIEQHPEWRTAGVVRGLLKVVDERNFSEPKTAADLAELAVKVAHSIEPSLYPLDTITKLRAAAWHELGYADYRIGSFRESLQALDKTDELLRECMVSEYESADVALHRAQLYAELERLDEGIRLADAASEIFWRFQNIRRVAVAKATKANLLMAARRYDEALLVHQEIAANSSVDELSRAIAVYHAAMCHREQSRFSEAKTLFARSIDVFERLGLTSRRAKARWSLGSVFALEHQLEDALALFSEVRQEFEDLGMAQDVALASVDAAEVLMMLDRPGEVVDLCRAAMDYFTNAGLAYTQGALTALAYLKEAAAGGRLSKSTVVQVREFFELLPKQPHLLFAFPL